MRVLFAPDWRNGVPYQDLLAKALERLNVQVSFLSGYRRVLPLARLMPTVCDCDILHMHWPEAYFPNKGDHFDWFRSARFPVDLARGTRNCRLVMTAHNFHIHNR